MLPLHFPAQYTLYTLLAKWQTLPSQHQHQQLWMDWSMLYPNPIRITKNPTAAAPSLLPETSNHLLQSIRSLPLLPTATASRCCCPCHKVELVLFTRPRHILLPVTSSHCRCCYLMEPDTLPNNKLCGFKSLPICRPFPSVTSQPLPPDLCRS